MRPKPAIPWWAWPWRSNRILHAVIAGQLAEMAKLHERINDLTTAVRTANRQLEACGQDRESLRAEVARWKSATAAAATDARVSGSALATSVPEFVLVGMARGAGKRIQVSRDVELTAFAMTEPDDLPPRFRLGAVMAHLIMIDKPTYAEALAHLATMWANEDAAQGAPWKSRRALNELLELEDGNQDHL